MQPLDRDSPRTTFGRLLSGRQAIDLTLPLRPAATLLLAAALAACDSFDEPERFYNDDARPPVVGALDLGSLRAGQHVAGAVELALDLDSLRGRLDRAEVLVDDQTVASFDGTQTAVGFVLNTYLFSEGEHLVSVVVHVRNPTGGLLNVVGAPAAVLAVPLVFDQTPPTPVRGLAASLDGLRPVVAWEPNADANFHAYVVYRRSWPERWNEPGDGVEVARITDRSATSFTDAALAEVHGGGASYVVAVSNRATERRTDQPATVAYGTWRAVSAPSGRAVASADGREVYAVVGPDLVASSPATGGTLRRLRLRPDESYPLQLDLQLDAVTGRLYVTTDERRPDWTLRVVDPATFDVLSQYRLPSGATQFAVRGGRLFVAGGSQGAQVHVLDAATGAVLGRSGASLQFGTQVEAVSADGRAVYVVEYLGSEPNRLVRFDVSTDTPALTHRCELSYAYVGAVAATAGGRVVVQDIGGSVRSFDGGTLAPIATFDPGGGFDPYSGSRQVVREVGGRLYVVYGGRTDPARPGSEVVALDPASLTLLQTYVLVGALTDLVPGPDGLLAVGGLGSWVLPY